MNIKTIPHTPLGMAKLHYYFFAAEAETKDGVLIEWFIRVTETKDINTLMPFFMVLIQNYYAKTHKKIKHGDVILREYREIKKADYNRLLKQGNVVEL